MKDRMEFDFAVPSTLLLARMSRSVLSFQHDLAHPAWSLIVPTQKRQQSEISFIVADHRYVYNEKKLLIASYSGTSRSLLSSHLSQIW